MRNGTLKILALALALSAAAPASAPRAQQPDGSDGGGGARVLAPTNHPRLPQDLSQLWLAPPSGHNGHTFVENELTAAVKLEVDAKFAQALLILSQPTLQQGPLGAYAIYFAALAHLRLGQHDEARRAFQTLEAQQPVGLLSEAAALGEAECDEALGDPAGALAVYERLSKVKTTAPDEVLMRLGRAAKAVGDLDKAVAAFSRVYYEFPLGEPSSLAGDELDMLPNVPPVAAGNAPYRLELARAERLFAARRYAPAKKTFAGIRRASSGDDRALVNLRIAECDYYLKRVRIARDGIRPYLDHPPRQSEALYFYAVAMRDLGGRDEYLKMVRRIVTDFPDEPWAEEALNNLASYHLVQDDDGEADAVFRELYEKYPTGRYSERAAWKIGWFAYKNGQYSETVRVLEKAALDFPRSDYRPSWLYWAGRSHEAVKNRPLAEARYTLVATDYLNSYYGRLAASRLDGRVPQRQLVVDERGNGSAPASGTNGDIELASLPPNDRIVRALLSVELYDQAIDELHYAQKVWGDSPVIQATLGWAYHQRGDLRLGINAMKRAYPQYLAAGGERLPVEILRVLFPINYWPLIQRYSAERDLDPYLVAALVAQESTFTADIRSSANAYGLMQIVPATGRRYAKALGLKRFSIGLLKTAELNVRMGTAYFSDLVKRFGDAHLALASYNAGEHRVVRWIAERPGVDRDEFIDDIPFPETQNYVKRILGTAEDYRRLYGPGAATRAGEEQAAAAPAAAASAKSAASAVAATKPSSASTRIPSAGKPSAARTKKAAPITGKTAAPAAKKKTRKSA